VAGGGIGSGAGLISGSARTRGEAAGATGSLLAEEELTGTCTTRGSGPEPGAGTTAATGGAVVATGATGCGGKVSGLGAGCGAGVAAVGGGVCDEATGGDSIRAATRFVAGAEAVAWFVAGLVAGVPDAMGLVATG